MFTLGADKTRYIINHGVAPYFYEILKANVNLADFYVISFDESMNSITQNNQMDCFIRYWDSEANLVKVRFLEFFIFRSRNSQGCIGKV